MKTNLKRTNENTERHYYSEKLKQKLNQLTQFSTTIVEAPSGYGKTTAIRDFLETSVPEDTPIYWFTAMEETATSAFRRLSNEINKVDDDVGECLLKIGLPNVATIGEACDALRAIRCKQETYLVLDNIQLLQDLLMPSFFTALVAHGGEGLHVIIITQMMGLDMYRSITNCKFLQITTSDLRLSADDIRNYYELEDVIVTVEEAQDIECRSEGWIIAVYLQLKSFKEKGVFADTNLLSLMECLVWSEMTKEQQDFLMRLSPFDSITLQQIYSLLKIEVLPKYALEALQNPFIRYERIGLRYELHSILSELLKQKRKEQGPTFDYECLSEAGNLFRDEGKIAEAMKYYWWINGYQQMLSLDFSHLIFEDIGNTPFIQIAMTIAEKCPVDIKKANLLSMLRIAWTLLTFGYYERFDYLMEELQFFMDSIDGQENIYGEWLLVSSFRHYPDLDKMIITLKKSEKLFKGKSSKVILPHSPWWFGSCAPLADFHIIPGEADHEGGQFETYITLLSKLTNGYGSGADILYQAVLAYHRGNISEAEMLAYKASYVAESKNQSIIQLGATLQLAQVALHKGDTEGWQHAINSMERAASYDLLNSFVINAALDIMSGMLLIELQLVDKIADWLKKGDFSQKRLLPKMLPLALFIHSLYLLHQDEVPRLIGLIEANQSKESINQPVNYMLLSLNLAVGYLSIGNTNKANSLLRNIGQKVFPDGMLFTYASFSWLLQGLSDQIIEKEYPTLFDQFKEIKERFEAGWIKLHQDLSPDELPLDLTEREHEVAILAAEGLHNNEIANKLFISESTVRTHMRTIFKKLDIDRRIKLAEKLAHPN